MIVALYGLNPPIYGGEGSKWLAAEKKRRNGVKSPSSSPYCLQIPGEMFKKKSSRGIKSRDIRAEAEVEAEPKEINCVQNNNILTI